MKHKLFGGSIISARNYPGGKWEEAEPLVEPRAECAVAVDIFHRVMCVSLGPLLLMRPLLSY